jgi:iron complex transport system substrate-binding protein
MIDAAGGVDVIAIAGERSAESDWARLAAADAEDVVVMPCGFGAEASERQAGEHLDRLRALGAQRAWAVDAASSFSRPGPRLVDGVELLAHLLHPGALAAPTGIRFSALAL